MTQRRGPKSSGSPADAPPQKPGTNPDGRTPVELPSNTRKTEKPPHKKR